MFDNLMRAVEITPFVVKVGDPTFIGWAIVICYFFAMSLSIGCLVRYVRCASCENQWQNIFLWLVCTIVLLGLGVNKQLDIQSWITLVGRNLAKMEGWYDSRRGVQYSFILWLTFLSFICLSLFLYSTRKAVSGNVGTVVGLVLLFVFVIIRATSFHHVDLFLHADIAGMKLNWVLELAGIGFLLLSALFAYFRPLNGQAHKKRFSFLDSIRFAITSLLAPLWRLNSSQSGKLFFDLDIDDSSKSKRLIKEYDHASVWCDESSELSSIPSRSIKKDIVDPHIWDVE